MANVADSMLFVQLIGSVALTLSLVVFQVNKRSNMLMLQMSAALLYAAHFLLLGAFTGAAMNVMGAVRNYMFYKVKRRYWVLPAGFIGVFIVAALLTWQGPLSLLPMFGMITGTLAFWQLNPRYIRMLAILSPPLWFTYNAISGSYPGMIAEIILLTSNVVGMYRFDIGKDLKIK